MDSREKKSVVDSVPWPHLHKGFKDSWTLCSSLCSLKWLKPRRSHVISSIPLRLWQLYTDLAVGLINWRIFFLNVRKRSELGRLGSNLFHSEIVDGKKEFLKKIYLDLKIGRLCIFLVAYGARLLRMLVFKYFIERGSFLYQRRSLRDSKPNSWYNFSFNVPLIALVIVRHALYWTDFNRSWKELLNAWSYEISP